MFLTSRRLSKYFLHRPARLGEKIRDYLMTRSALAKTLGGITNSICLAVFKLITNSKFLDCSGYAPSATND
jgi:hypothetical protein